MSGYDDFDDDNADDDVEYESGGGVSVGIKLSGRSFNLGEKNPLKIIGNDSIRDRLLYGSIDVVDDNNGTVAGPLIGVGGGLMYATVPPLWFSMSGETAAWGRYMPQKGDVAKIVYGPDNSQHIIGYDPGNAKSGQNSAVPGYGWPGVYELHKKARADPRARIETEDGSASVPLYKYAQFETLNQGEYDFMSSGGAYIRGFKDGKLYLAGGGGTTVSLNKVDMSIMSASQVLVHSADKSEFRFGQVRRMGPDMIESKLQSDSLGVNREFRVVLKNATAPGVAVDCASLEVGNVATAEGIMDVSFYGSPVKYSYRAHNSTGMQTHRTSVDELGNWRVESESVGSVAEVTYPSVKLNGSVDFTVTSPNITLSGPGSGLPTYPTILSTPYRAAEDTLVTELARQIDFLSSQLVALSTGLAASSAAITSGSAAAATPVTNGTLAVFLAGLAPSIAVQAAVSPTVASATIAATGFKSYSSTYLSTIVKNG